MGQISLYKIHDSVSPEHWMTVLSSVKETTLYNANNDKAKN